MPRRAKGVRLYLRERRGREAQYFIVDGRREVATGCGIGDSEAASRALAEYISNKDPDTSRKRLKDIRVGEVIMLYVRRHAPKTSSAETISYHSDALNPFWSEKTLADVLEKTSDEYLLHRQTGKRPVKASTVRRELKTLQAAINYWHRNSPLMAVPQVTLPPPGESRERVLERSEAAALLRAARKLGYKHIIRFILIAIYTGTRHNAILSLRWMPSLSSGHVDVERGIIYRRGSAERETSKRRPPVRPSPRLISHLRRWHCIDHKKSIAHVIHYQRQPVKKERKAFAAVVKAAGLGKDVTPHVLRHTAASWLLWEGKTIWDVAGVIGADASTVERVYGHHRLQHEERKRA